MKPQGNRILGDDNPTASPQGTEQSRRWQRMDMRGQSDKNQHINLCKEGTVCFLRPNNSSKTRLPVQSRTMDWESPDSHLFLCLLLCCKASPLSLRSLHRFSVHMEEYILLYFQQQIDALTGSQSPSHICRRKL